MRKTWLIFSQAVTVAVAVLFVVATLKPQWLHRDPAGAVRCCPIVRSRADRRRAAAAAGAQRVAARPVAGVTSYSAAAKRASPAVVSITASKAPPRSAAQRRPVVPVLLRRPRRASGRSEPQVGLGSGVIVSAEGYLLTNNHVVEGADDIEVRSPTAAGASAQAGRHRPETDVAVLKIDARQAAGDRLRRRRPRSQVGDVVLAIGNPFGVGQTVTSGIVSALGRNQLGINTFENFIQTDAAINPGNSGGALVDANGNLLGINTAIYSRSGGSLGIGFAIPVSTARQVMEGLIKDGQVTRGWIGVEPRDLTPEIAETLEPADPAGRADHRRAAGRPGQRRRPAPGRRGA